MQAKIAEEQRAFRAVELHSLPMTPELTKIERRDGGVAVLYLCRIDKRNALSQQLRDAISADLAALRLDDGVRSIVLTGTPDCFCAGYDISELAETGLRSLFVRAVSFTKATYYFPKPVVVAVGGFALGGGFDLALSGDLIVSTPEARFGRPEVRFGLNPILSKLAQRVGIPRAVQLSTTGELLGGELAHELGVVDTLSARGELLDSAVEAAERFAIAPGWATRAVKRTARAIGGMDARAAIEYEYAVTAEICASSEVTNLLYDHARRVNVSAAVRR